MPKPKAKPRGKPFTKGDPRRGPGGPRKRPDFITIVESLPQTIKDELLKCQLTGEAATVYQMYAIQLLCKVGEGDSRSLQELGDRLMGKPTQALEIEHDGKIEIAWKPLSATPRTQDSSDSTPAEPDSA
ncbi:MAG TPA: hypothetical protein VMY37_38425 [Thermoguttaceae bacterium]|nr:hypothetical protein [Thermoguttaceae bacterium]